jgi:hypothetical protein
MSPHADHELLRQIYARVEFAHAKETNGDYLVQLFRRLGDFLSSLGMSQGVQGYASFSRGIVFAIAAVLAGLGMMRLAKLRLRNRAEAGASARKVRREGLLKLEPPERHLARARALLSTSPREALRASLLGLLSTLESHEWLGPNRVATNREVISELQERGAPAQIQTALTPLLRWYDERFYSLGPIPEAQAESFLNEVTKLGITLGPSA